MQAISLRLRRFLPIFLTLLLGLSQAQAAILPRKSVEVLRRALAKTVERTLERANKSDRVDLGLRSSFLDDENQIFLDVQGVLRVEVPKGYLEKKIRPLFRSGRAMVLSSDGPLSLDLAARPMKIEGQEVTFACQFDLLVLTDRFVQNLLVTGASFFGSQATGKVAEFVAHAVLNIRSDILGDAIVHGIKTMGGFLAGRGAQIWSGWLRDLGSTKRRILETLQRDDWASHVGASLMYAISASGATIVGATLGGAIGAAILPAAPSLVAVFVTTTAALWFGSWVVENLMVRWPILWRIRRLEKAWAKRKAGNSDPGLTEKIENAHKHLSRKLDFEMGESSGRWIFFELLLEHLEKRAKKEPSFDREAFAPLAEVALNHLQFRIIQDKNIRAARYSLRLRAALGMLPHQQGTAHE